MACVSAALANTVDVSEDGEERDLTNSANMPYAMTSRNVRRPALLPGNILTKVNPASYSNPNESTVIDSGYASELSTPETQNGTPKASFKGGTSFSPAKFLQRKTTRLREFDKIMPAAAAQDRFKDLNELFGKPLYDYVTKSGATFSAISIKLKILGEGEDTAKPWIVVLCDKRIAKRVKRFFSQSWVKSECQPCHTDPGRPSFEILVYDRPPIPMAIMSSASVYADWRGDALKGPTLCGSIISVNTEGHTRLATLGGVLSVTMAGGNTELYCMTVSHVIAGDQLEKDAYKPQEFSREADEDVEEEDSDDASEADVFSCEKQEYTLDLDFEGDRDSGAVSTAKQNPSSGNSTPSLLKIGYIAITSCDAVEDGSNLDWALIKIDDSTLYCPNLLFIPGDSDQSHVLYEPKDLSFSKSKIAQSVFLLSGTRGVIGGMLSFTLSLLMLAPGKRFTDTYTLRLSDGLGLNAGDCGSWVVDSHTHEVYGQVVASDAFGDAYVIPMKTTFSCIQKQLSAQLVCFPRQNEEQEWIIQKVDEPASEAKVESSMDFLRSTIEGEQSGETCSDQNLILMRDIPAFHWTKHMVEASPTSQEAGGAGGLEQEISFPMAEDQWWIETRADERVSDAQFEPSIHLPGPTTEGKQSGETCSGPDSNIFTGASLGFPICPDAGFKWTEQTVEGTSPAWQTAPPVRGLEPQENLFPPSSPLPPVRAFSQISVSQFAPPTSPSASPDLFGIPPFVDSGYNSRSVTATTSPQTPLDVLYGDIIKLTNCPPPTPVPDWPPSTEQLNREWDDGDSDGPKDALRRFRRRRL